MELYATLSGLIFGLHTISAVFATKCACVGGMAHSKLLKRLAMRLAPHTVDQIHHRTPLLPFTAVVSRPEISRQHLNALVLD
jgi:hypothetical protein